MCSQWWHSKKIRNDLRAYNSKELSKSYISSCQENGNKNHIFLNVMTCLFMLWERMTFYKNNYFTGNKFICLPWSISFNLAFEQWTTFTSCLVSSSTDHNRKGEDIPFCHEVQITSPLFLYLMSVNELLFSLTVQCSNKSNIAVSALPLLPR